MNSMNNSEKFVSLCKIQPESTSISSTKLGPNKEQFVVSPVERGYGLTIANSIRRVLLSHILGTAIFAIKIDGASHKFDTLDGVREDVMGIILNLKGVILKSPGLSKPIKLTLSAKGPTSVTAGMISVHEEVSVVNVDQVICTINKNINLHIELYVNSDFGYIPADQHNINKHSPQGSDSSQSNSKSIISSDDRIIKIDALYSPVNNVSYKIDPAVHNLEDVNRCEKVTMQIETNGAISSTFAIGAAATALKYKFSMFDQIAHSVGIGLAPVAVDESADIVPEIMTYEIQQMPIGTRAKKCLRGILYIGDLVQKTEEQLLALKNFGDTTLVELKSCLEAYTDPYNSKMKLRLGMKVPGWEERGEK